MMLCIAYIVALGTDMEGDITYDHTHDNDNDGIGAVTWSRQSMYHYDSSQSRLASAAGIGMNMTDSNGNVRIASIIVRNDAGMTAIKVPFSPKPIALYITR